MNEKEPIIIDGVDVTECEFLQQEDIDHDYTCYAEEGYQSGEICCSACPNCYYKQLKRKEQECFDLLMRANAYNSLVIIANDRLDKIEEKDKEIQELKEKYIELAEQNGNNIVQLNTVNEQLDQLKEKLDDVLMVNYEAIAERYKQALQQIREVVELAMEEVLTIGQRNATAKILEILQKCEGARC